MESISDDELRAADSEDGLGALKTGFQRMSMDYEETLPLRGKLKDAPLPESSDQDSSVPEGSLEAVQVLVETPGMVQLSPANALLEELAYQANLFIYGMMNESSMPSRRLQPELPYYADGLPQMPLSSTNPADVMLPHYNYNGPHYSTMPQLTIDPRLLTLPVQPAENIVVPPPRNALSHDELVDQIHTIADLTIAESALSMYVANHMTTHTKTELYFGCAGCQVLLWDLDKLFQHRCATNGAPGVGCSCEICLEVFGHVTEMESWTNQDA